MNESEVERLVIRLTGDAALGERMLRDGAAVSGLPLPGVKWEFHDLDDPEPDVVVG